jgi:hypothetical protein
MPAVLDAQQKELIGRAALEAELIRNGFEVARAHRDKGIDLIVFLDEPSKPFTSRPIQMKASAGTRFGVNRKYERMSGLILAYLWNVLEQPRFFLMSYAEAEAIVPVETKQTASWREGGWSWPSAPERVRGALMPYEDRWTWLREELQRAWR